MATATPERLDDLIATFAQSVIGQNEAIAQHDVVIGNRLASVYCNAAKELIAFDQPGMAAFARLLYDPRIAVRTMAAAFLIPFKTAESEAVLRSAAQETGISALGAHTALQRWETERKGIDLT